MSFDFSRKVSKFVFPDKPRKTAARYLVAVALPLLALAITGPFFTISTESFLSSFHTVSHPLRTVWGLGHRFNHYGRFRAAECVDTRAAIVVSGNRSGKCPSPGRFQLRGVPGIGARGHHRLPSTKAGRRTREAERHPHQHWRCRDGHRP